MSTHFTLRMPVNADELRPRKTYYYKRRDGSVFACEEDEARLIHSKYEQVGISDGTVFHNAYMKAIEKQNKELEKIGNPTRKSAAWKKKRAEIAEKAHKAILDAQAADQKAAMGHLAMPSAWNGVQGQSNQATNTQIARLISR